MIQLNKNLSKRPARSFQLFINPVVSKHYTVYRYGKMGHNDIQKMKKGEPMIYKIGKTGTQ